MSDDEYRLWWEAQFPCPCGHSPGSHVLAPIDGKCRACVECHDNAYVRYGIALAEAAHDPVS